MPVAALALGVLVELPDRIHSLASELLGEALPAVTPVEVLGEDALDRLEVCHRVVRDHQATSFERMAEGGVPVLPMSLFCL